MAFNPKKIFSIDQKPGTAVGIAIPFNAPGVFFSTYTTKDAIRNNLINFFLTNPTERYLNNGFGAGLRAFIFEQLDNDNVEFLRENIQTLLGYYFPDVIVEELSTPIDPDNNTITIQLFYSIKDTGMEDQIEITFE